MLIVFYSIRRDYNSLQKGDWSVNSTYVKCDNFDSMKAPSTVTNRNISITLYKMTF